MLLLEVPFALQRMSPLITGELALLALEQGLSEINIRNTETTILTIVESTTVSLVNIVTPAGSLGTGC